MRRSMLRIGGSIAGMSLGSALASFPQGSLRFSRNLRLSTASMVPSRMETASFSNGARYLMSEALRGDQR